jgi:phosphoglycolate phosphatase-like HAD superfamily hydrolase
MEYSVKKLNRSLANAEAKLRDNPDDSVVKGHVEVLKAELAKLATAPPGESSTFWGDVVGRVGLGQGLSMSGGDEAEAMARSVADGTDYSAELAQARARIERARKERPWQTGAAELVGGALPALVSLVSVPFTGGASAPLAAANVARTGSLIGNTMRGALRGAGLVPRTGSLIGNTMRGALRGAGAGAATGAVSGFGAGEGGPEGRLPSAALGAAGGGVLGGGFGAVAPVVGQTLRSVTSKPSQRAAQQILRQLERDKLSPGQIAEEYAARQVGGVKPEILADLYPRSNISLETRRVTNLPGANLREGARVLDDRARGQSGRIGEEFSEILETDTRMYPLFERLIEKRRQDSGPAYDAYRGYNKLPPGFGEAVQGIVQRGDKGLLALARDKARFEGRSLSPLVADINFTDADMIKRGLDRFIRNETDDATGRLTDAGRDHLQLRNELVDLIDSANPYYAPARAAWAGPSAMMEAAEIGRRLFMKSENPDVIRATAERMGGSEREAFMVGVLDAVTTKLGRTTDLESGSRQFMTGNAQASIKAIIKVGTRSDEEAEMLANRLLQNVERESQMAATRSATLNPSATASLSEAEKRAKDQTANILDLMAEKGMWRAGWTKLRNMGDAAIVGRKQNTQDQTNEIIRQMLYSNSAQSVNRAMNALQGEASKLERRGGGQIFPGTPSAYFPGLLGGSLGSEAVTR